MRKISIVLLFLAGLLMPASVMSAHVNINMSREGGGIDINEGGREEGGSGKGKGGPVHRSPSLIPIEASYDASSSVVNVNFLYDLGPVTVRLENLTAGVAFEYVVDAVAGEQSFPVSGVAGDYELVFTLADGRTYWGSFGIE